MFVNSPLIIQICCNSYKELILNNLLELTSVTVEVVGWTAPARRGANGVTAFTSLVVRTVT